MTAIDASGAPASPNIGNYLIFNNIITGFNYTAVSSVDQFYRGIRSGSSSVNLTIYNNSINMPDQAAVTNVIAGNVVGISYSAASPNPATTQKYSSNIVRVTEGGGLGLHRVGTVGTFVSNYTDVFATIFGRSATTNYATLAAWQTGTTKDANSASVDPTATAGSVWDATLHFVPSNVKPQGLNSAEPGLLATDYDGETRSAALPYPGMDELTAAALPVSLSGFSLE